MDDLSDKPSCYWSGLETVKEIAFYGGSIDKFVSPAVAGDVAARVAKLGRKGS
jgi:phosphopantetheine adenylyltransferase